MVFDTSPRDRQASCAILVMKTLGPAALKIVDNEPQVRNSVSDAGMGTSYTNSSVSDLPNKGPQQSTILNALAGGHVFGSSAIPKSPQACGGESCEFFWHGSHAKQQSQKLSAPLSQLHRSPFYPHNHKKELCHQWMFSKTCRYGSNCWYAHGASELANAPPPSPQKFGFKGAPAVPPSPFAVKSEPIKSTDDSKKERQNTFEVPLMATPYFQPQPCPQLRQHHSTPPAMMVSHVIPQPLPRFGNPLVQPPAVTQHYCTTIPPHNFDRNVSTFPPSGKPESMRFFGEQQQVPNTVTLIEEIGTAKRHPFAEQVPITDFKTVAPMTPAQIHELTSKMSEEDKSKLISMLLQTKWKKEMEDGKKEKMGEERPLTMASPLSRFGSVSAPLPLVMPRPLSEEICSLFSASGFCILGDSCLFKHEVRLAFKND